MIFHTYTCTYALAMSLLRNLKPRDGLPDPNGSLSQSVPSLAIAAVNEEVKKVKSGVKRRGLYRRYTPEKRLDRYASEHSIMVAACYFTR